MRAARAARLFLLARPLKFLICGVVFAVSVVDAKAPYFHPRDAGDEDVRNLWRVICAKITNGWCKSTIVSAELLIVGAKQTIVSARLLIVGFKPQSLVQNY